MFKQYVLPYEYDVMEPHIDATTMETHHSKHHKTYTDNLNDAAKKAGVENMDIEKLLGNLDKIEDTALRKAIRNNGGGFYNHNLYFMTISPKGGGEAVGKVAEKINEKFGSFENFKEEISKLALGQFGSGWAWLSANHKGEIMISASPNQDNPISEGTEFVPIFAIDVWEHAYYLKYKNLRGDYVKTIFEVVDWTAVEKNYEEVTA